jgi:hypothetical protein
MPKRKARPVTVSAPHKGRSKSKGGIALDELLAAHVSGRAVRATEKTPARASTTAKPTKTEPTKAPGRRFLRRDDAQVVQNDSPRLVGYARISTDDQTTALQADALARAAVDVVFQEEASGANTARPVLAEALAALKSGDTLVVWRLDRLGRSLGHLIEVAGALRERGIFLRSLTEGFDTSTASGRLLYHVLGAVAEFEREVIKERTVAGMKAAKKRGTHVGRPQALVGSRLPIVVLDCGVVRAALVDVDDLGKAVVLDGAREEPPCRTTIAFGGQQEVDRVALFIHGTIPVTIFPTDLDIGFVQAPTLAHRTDASFALPFTKGLLQHRNQLDDPAGNRGMIDEHAALLHDLFEIAQTQRVGDVPPDAQQHDVQWKSQPLDHASRIVHKCRMALKGHTQADENIWVVAQ